jgi:hypothetical protein
LYGPLGRINSSSTHCEIGRTTGALARARHQLRSSCSVVWNVVTSTELIVNHSLAIIQGIVDGSEHIRAVPLPESFAELPEDRSESTKPAPHFLARQQATFLSLKLQFRQLGTSKSVSLEVRTVTGRDDQLVQWPTSQITPASRSPRAVTPQPDQDGSQVIPS